MRPFSASRVGPCSERSLVARRYFLPLTAALAAEYGRVRVVTCRPDDEPCGERCQRVRGPECRWACGGVDHGIRSSLGGYARGWGVEGTAALDESGWTEWRWVVSEPEGMNAAEMHAWIEEESGRLTGMQLPVPDAEAIMAGFIRRFGQRDATRIARAAIEVHCGIWMGAPITPRRFTQSNDQFFARRVLARLNRGTPTTRVA